MEHICKICGSELRTVKLYMQHCRIHSNLPKLRFPCCFRHCLKTSSSLTGLRMHICRDHGTKALWHMAVNADQMGIHLRCSLESCTVICENKTELMKHLRQHIKEGIKIECPIKLCKKKYNVISSFSCHLSRDHTNWITTDLKPSVNPNPVLLHDTVSESLSSGIQLPCEDLVEDEDVSDPAKVLNRDEFIKNLSLFFSRLSTVHLIPDSTLDIIGNELQNVNSLNQCYLKQHLTETLNIRCTPRDVIQTVMAAFEDGDVLKECLGVGGTLGSCCRRASFVRQNFNFVSPVPVYVGTTSKNKSRHCHYIPIKQSVLAFLEDPSVLKQCLSPHQSTDGILRDFTDGTIYKQATSDSKILSVKNIQQEWPFLVEPKWMVQHLERLLGFDILTTFENGLLSRKTILLNFFRTKGGKDLKKDVAAADGDGQPAVCVIPMLLKYFEEEEKVLLLGYENIPDTTDSALFTTLPTTPCLLFEGPQLYMAAKFRLVVDQVCISSSIESPVVAVALLFGTFFLFNIQYPNAASATLEFIQRVFLKINPTTGSKVQKTSGKKARSGVHEAVLSLVKDMSVSDVLSD